MPSRAARLCGCGAVVRDGGSCRSCSSRRKRESDSHRPTARARGYTTQWDKARAGYLARHPYCVMCEAEGKQVLASVVDHIIPHRGDNELFWDSSNWAALCVPHHSGDKQSMEARTRATRNGEVATRVELICGPPAAGKSTYVQSLIKAGDLIVDLDMIFSAISGLDPYDKPQHLLPFVKEAQAALLRRLVQPSLVQRAWVIATAPTAEQREKLCRGLNAHVTVLATPPSVCMRRIIADPIRRPAAAQWRKLVDDWWNKWNPSQGVQRVITGALIEREGGRLKVFDHAPGPAASATRETISE